MDHSLAALAVSKSRVFGTVSLTTDLVLDLGLGQPWTAA